MTGGGNAAREAQIAREEQQKREADIAAGTRDIRTSFMNQFNNDYYTKMKADAKKYYETSKGGLNEQFEAARKQLSGALIGRGLDDSSIGNTMNNRLNDQKAAGENQITEMGINAEAQKKQDLLQAQNSVIAQLQNSGDAGIAMAQAAQAQSMNATRAPYSLLGSVFQDATAGLATQAQLENAGMNRYNVFNRNPYNNTGGRRYMRTVGG
jgi:hypothetical protein